MASLDSIMAPSNDSSASRLWGGTRPTPSGCYCSGRTSLMDCTNPPASPRSARGSGCPRKHSRVMVASIPGGEEEG